MQRGRCQKFCAQMGWTIVCEMQEEGVSGHKVRAEKRDKIQLIKEYAQQKRFDILLVFMFDRLGRIADETPFLVEWFVRNGVRVWSAEEGEQKFDTHTDKLLNYIRFWQADGESEKTSIRTSNSMGLLTEQGCFTGGTLAYGYQFIKTGRTNKRKQEVNDLAICDEEAYVVRLIFRLAATEGYGAQRIANHLNEKGIKNRSGKNWHPASIQGMMRNILYTGILRSGKSQSPVIEELRIIDDKTFNKVDLIVDAIIRGVFRRARNLSRDDIINAQYRTDMRERQAYAEKVKQDYSEAEANLQRLKNEIIKSITGQSAFSPDILNGAIQEQQRLCDELQHTMNEAEKAVTEITSQRAVFDRQYDELLEWANAYDKASMSAKKMIVSQMIERVDVNRGYHLQIKFRISVERLIYSMEAVEKLKASA